MHTHPLHTHRHSDSHTHTCVLHGRTAAALFEQVNRCMSFNWAPDEGPYTDAVTQCHETVCDLIKRQTNRAHSCKGPIPKNSHIFPLLRTTSIVLLALLMTGRRWNHHSFTVYGQCYWAVLLAQVSHYILPRLDRVPASNPWKVQACTTSLCTWGLDFSNKGDLVFWSMGIATTSNECAS